MRFIILLIFSALYINSNSASCQLHTSYTEDSISIKREGKQIFGSIIIPDNNNSRSVVLIIAGSGPTDRNGNNPMMTNNSLKMLAESLESHGISSVRYDKRGVAASLTAGIPEINLRFEDYVEDAVKWIELLKKDSRFEKVLIIGHSEGSLIGMMVAQMVEISAFISIGGPGEPADLVLKRQLQSQPQFVRDQIFSMIDSLKEGYTLKKVDPSYFALFRPSVQPYMISWLKYDPQSEIQKLDVPILIIQGNADMQVRVEDAKLLKKAAPLARLEIVDGMNHIFKPSSTDHEENIATYRDPDLPIKGELAQVIAEFISLLGKD